MTMIDYPDCEATSLSGRFYIEARSPDNGSIPRLEGSSNDLGEAFGGFQRDFRYRLIRREVAPARAGGIGDNVIWERRQLKGEDSPRELVVADDGWSAIRTHGFQPQVILLTPEGAVFLRVCVVSEDDEAVDDSSLTTGEDKDVSGSFERSVAWRAKYLSHSTAGSWWAQNSWPYFCDTSSGPYFVWRTYWGDRLVVNLTNGELVAEGEQTTVLKTAFDDTERQVVNNFFADLWAHETAAIAAIVARRVDREAVWTMNRNPASRLIPAIYLVGVHQMQTHVPLLQRWEVLEVPSSYTSCVALGDGWSIESQMLRPVLCQSLRTFGVESAKYPAYNFRRGDAPVERFDLPTGVSDRRAQLLRLPSSAAASDVLSVVGAPDHVRKKSHPEGDGFCGWTEEWEYDCLVEDGWKTIRLAWEQVKNSVKLVSKEEEASYWVSSARRSIEQLRW